ncbi:MAG: hypothetical protein J6M37_01545, partial [Prevotella sp.]|nr:hypothetical protein [Prevotella sp.]
VPSLPVMVSTAWFPSSLLFISAICKFFWLQSKTKKREPPNAAPVFTNVIPFYTIILHQGFSVKPNIR